VAASQLIGLALRLLHEFLTVDQDIVLQPVLAQMRPGIAKMRPLIATPSIRLFPVLAAVSSLGASGY
jgi:hypothetical protein